MGTAAEARQLIRRGDWTGHTSGLAPSYVQGNLVIVPVEYANDFLLFCQRNPKPCPILGVTEPGSPYLPALGIDLDLRCDLPRYRVWRHGQISSEPTEVRDLWRDDLVSFVLGCSFSFEQALLDAGIRLRHIEQGINVAMYRTNIEAQAAGRFRGPVVVSMRPLPAAAAIRSVQITSRFPQVHGAPVHVGNPAQIGIADLSRPDYGDPVAIEKDELPVFWACGVTPQAALIAAKLDFCITHAPGAMLITDLRNNELASL
ncbi:Putative hydro-lyase [Burkholderiales bacterium]|nr:MAG: putative hydro-lyase [Burkholderiales bacterium]CAG1012556.1 Putative hydro-lyase [Burkholderiales bacterium]